jgi:dTDP-4-amino-4,6-dideoxygalactose transaminase
MSPGLELTLCRLHQRSHCVPVASGTVGLTLTLQALRLQSAGVAMPSGVCLNVPLAIAYAGALPVYCDIDADTLGLSPSTLSRTGAAFSAVVAVHAYGNTCDMDALAGYCGKSSVQLIEDVAAAQGATVGGRPAGSFGRASILSFGRGKIIDAGGGGAVLTDDPGLAREIRHLYRNLPARREADSTKLEDFSSWHTRLYNQHYGGDLAQHVAPFAEAALTMQTATLTRSDWNGQAVVQQLESLNDNLARRQVLSEYLFRRIEACAAVRCHRPPAGSAPWRAGVFIPNYRNRILRALLGEQLKISSWYPPAQLFLKPDAAGDTPVAKRVGDEILNVWVNHEADTAYLDRVSQKILELTREAP